jgi:hypothetical protein
MKSRTNDYLKYWRVIRYWVKAKYNLSQADMDILFFLYSEQYFGRDRFQEFDELLSWDEHRFNRLRDEGWIQNFRPHKRGVKALYALSFKATRMMDTVYKKLNGEEIPMTNTSNPLFMKKVNYNDKVYRNMIKQMNKEIREDREKSKEQ